MNLKLNKTVIIRIKQLLEKHISYGKFKDIAHLLKDEFLCLSDISIDLLSERVRYYNEPIHKLNQQKSPLFDLIGTTHKSLTPVLTVSKHFLVTYNLWENTIRLSGLKRVQNVLHYVGELQMGANVNFRDDMDMSTVKLGCLLIICNVNDWLEGHKFPSDIFHISLSEDHGPDEFVLLMMAGNHSMRVEKGQKVWDKKFVTKIQKNMKITVKGDGSVHFRSLGKFFGFGMMEKCNKNGVCSYARVVENKKAIPNELNMLY